MVSCCSMSESSSDPTKINEPVLGGETVVLNAGKTEAAPDINTLINRWGASRQGRTNEEVGLELLNGGATSLQLNGVDEQIIVTPSRSKAALHFGSVANIPLAVVDAFTHYVSLPSEATVVYVPGKLAFTKDGTIDPRGSTVLVLNRTQYRDIVQAREAQRQARE